MLVDNLFVSYCVTRQGDRGKMADDTPRKIYGYEENLVSCFYEIVFSRTLQLVC